MAQKTEEKTELFEISQKSAPTTVCFVCTGNTCRSPMAEAIFHGIAKEKGIDARAVSAGLAANDGAPMSANARTVLTEAGIEFDLNFASKNVDAPLMAKCDKVIGITARHAMELMMRFPQFAKKIYSFPCDIPDPFGGDTEVYRACMEKIRSALEEMTGETDA